MNPLERRGLLFCHVVLALLVLHQCVRISIHFAANGTTGLTVFRVVAFVALLALAHGITRRSRVLRWVLVVYLTTVLVGHVTLTYLVREPLETSLGVTFHSPLLFSVVLIGTHVTALMLLFSRPVRVFVDPPAPIEETFE